MALSGFAMDEFSFIEYLQKKIRRPGNVLIGIGDDAAVLDTDPAKKLVVSSDTVVEDV